jgi:hypothetical protein
MKYLTALLLFVTITSCAKKATLRTPEVIRQQGYTYVQDEDGRFFVFTTNTKDFDEAMKKIKPGPASVDKIDLWVITPLRPEKK